MAFRSGRFIAALLLASYGLISVCGAGLHTLVDGAHDAIEAQATHDGDHHHHAPDSRSADHGDCLICDVAGQGQMLVLADPIASGTVEAGESPPPPTVDHCPPDRLLSDPRAPPRPLV